jgi:predicted 3-demethylubiquinone-9 3-methyltransferase (glyoxalase superfamily)
MQKITPFLWFDNNAEEAMDFYTSVFHESRVVDESRYGEGAPVPAGTLMSATIELEGQEFILFNGGPLFAFTEAVSMFVSCATQQEIDALWGRLTEGGEPGRCGWLKDRFGLSWQIVPPVLGTLLGDPDPEKAGRVMQAMLQMGKLDIAELERAAHASQ